MAREGLKRERCGVQRDPVGKLARMRGATMKIAVQRSLAGLVSYAEEINATPDRGERDTGSVGGITP